jgi:hypothetical protein
MRSTAARRRRTQKKVEPTPAPHPLRVNGTMPDELPQEEFLEWLILNGMTEEDYKASVKLGEAFLAAVKEHGRPIPTDKLDPDQRGWAQAEHPQHYNNEIARWVPFKVTLHQRTRTYNDHCSCGEEEQDYKFWGTRWDGRALMQCQNCGEVVVPNGNGHVRTDDDKAGEELGVE